MSQTPSTNTTPIPQPSRPNEQGAIHVQGMVRIMDPKTGEVILEQRS